MKRAQRSRIAANTASMAELIFKKAFAYHIGRSWPQFETTASARPALVRAPIRAQAHVAKTEIQIAVNTPMAKNASLGCNMQRALSSDARCNTPCRFDIGLVRVAMPTYSHLLDEERDQIAERGGPLNLRHRQGASASQIHCVAGVATQRPSQRALLAALRRRSLSIAQAA